LIAPLALSWILLLAPPSAEHHGRDWNAPRSRWLFIREHISRRACELDRNAMATSLARKEARSGETDEDIEIRAYLILLELECITSDDPTLL
jgi:hypothetical protein